MSYKAACGEYRRALEELKEGLKNLENHKKALADKVATKEQRNEFRNLPQEDKELIANPYSGFGKAFASKALIQTTRNRASLTMEGNFEPITIDSSSAETEEEELEDEVIMPSSKRVHFDDTATRCDDMQMETETAKSNPVESSSTMLIIPGAQVEMEPEIDIGDLGKPDALDYFQSLNSFSKYWFSRTIEGDNITILDVPALHMDKRDTLFKKIVN